jgi:hypothetical protein
MSLIKISRVGKKGIKRSRNRKKYQTPSSIDKKKTNK